MRKPWGKLGETIEGPFLFSRHYSSFSIRRTLPRASSIIPCILMMAACLAPRTLDAQTVAQVADCSIWQLDCSTEAVNVEPQVLTTLQPMTGVNGNTCASLGSGTWTVTTPPLNGTISTQIVNMPIELWCGPFGGPDVLEDNIYPVINLNYIWTSKSPGANTDYVVAYWSNPNFPANIYDPDGFEWYFFNITMCSVPTITSISTSTWLAGETYKKVDITGTNFITSDNATAGCPMTQLTVTAATGGVTVSGVNVSSDTKITATLKPDDDDPTEPATVIAKNGSSTGTATAQINGLPPAKIEWNGDEISGTTQSAVVGQKIELKAKPKEKLAAGYTLSKSTWVVDPTNIGELQEPAGNHGFKTGNTVLDKPDTSFYWLYPHDGLNASYTYCATVPSGKEVCPQTTKATATFDVSGPDSPNLYPCDGTSLSGCTAGDPLPSAAIGHGERLQLGADGIMFTASDDTSSPTGKFSFVQLLDSYIMTYTYQYERPCTKNIADKGSGLDNYYPYPPITTTSTWDFPKVLLFGDDAEVTVSFQAGLFLMWESTGTSDSIPVSLGSLVWGWSGDAVQDQKSHDWSIKPTSGGPANVTSFVESSAYPQWAVIYHNPNGNDCAH